MLLPKVKLKSIVSFPAAVFGGMGIAVRKQNGKFYFDLDFHDFAPPVATLPDAANQNLLFFNSVSGAYTLAPFGVINNVPSSSTIYLTGSFTGVCPARAINVSDDVQMSPSMTDPNGNYTPEGWYNVSAYTFNWTSGALGTWTGARTAVLANLFFTHPSASGNTARYYSPIISTANFYVDDNGSAGTPAGDGYGLATVSYLAPAVKHWHALFAYEADMTCAAGSAVQYKYGIGAFLANEDAVQGSVHDIAFAAVSTSATSLGWRNAFAASNNGGTALSSDGTLLATMNAMTFANAIDVSNSIVTGHLFKSGPLKITGQGQYLLNLTAPVAGDGPATALYSNSASQHIYTTMGRVSTSDLNTGVCGVANDFLNGTVAGDAVIGYSGALAFGHVGVGAVPHMKISSGGVANFALSPTVPTANAADFSINAASTAYVDSAAYGLRGHLSGYQLTNNAVTPNSKIDIAGGFCRDQNFNRYNLASGGLTKDLAANWAAGNAGGLDTGVKAINTWYFLFAILNVSNPASPVVDVLFSASPTAPTLPSGFTAFRRIRGAVLTDGVGTGNIIRFVQIGSTFKWSVPVKDFDGTFITSTAASLRKLTTPLGLKLIAIFHGRGTTTTSPIATLFTDPAMADTVPDFSFAQQLSNSTLAPFVSLQVGTDTLSQVRTRSNFSDASTTLFIITEGWIDTGEL